MIDDIEVVDLESRYKVAGSLCQGGMGAVLLATDTRLGRKVAMKRILCEESRIKTAINLCANDGRRPQQAGEDH